MKYLWITGCIMGFTTYVNAASYTIKFVNNTAYDVKFYELTIPASQATLQNFSNYISPGTTIKQVSDGTSYTFTTKTATKSIYMIVPKFSESLFNPLKFDVSSAHSGTLTITSAMEGHYIAFSIKKGTTLIVGEKYYKEIGMH